MHYRSPLSKEKKADASVFYTVDISEDSHKCSFSPKNCAWRKIHDRGEAQDDF